MSYNEDAVVEFARLLIGQPGEASTRRLYKGAPGVFWVDWREADEDIIALAAACFGGDVAGNSDELKAQWIEGKLHVSFRDRLLLVPLEFKPGEQDLTLLALNRALAPDFEIRHIKASAGGDSAAFMLLRRDKWVELETSGAAKVDAAFGRLEPGSSLFAPGDQPTPGAVTAADDLRASLSLERVTKARELTAQKKYAEAIAGFEALEKRYASDAHPRIQLHVLMSLVSRGIALAAQGKPLEAIAAYDEAERRFGTSSDTTRRALVCSALFNKSLCLRALARTSEELALYDLIDQRYGEDVDPAIREAVIGALRNKAFRLGAAGEHSQQTALYDLIVKRYDGDTAPFIRAGVALSRNGAAYSRMMSAKQHWNEREQRSALLRQAITDLRSALENCEQQWRVMVQGNLGYALFLAGDKLSSARETQECLRLGRKAALEGQRSDAAACRVEQVDAEYEDMLRRLSNAMGLT